MPDEYEERLRKELQKDIERFNKTGELPKDYDVRKIRKQEMKSKKKQKIEDLTDQIKGDE